MADVLAGIGGGNSKRYKDMGDGTYAEVVSATFEGTIGEVTTTSETVSAIARGGSIAAGGTSQTAIAANVSRKGFMIQNPTSAAEQGIASAENLYINMTNAATLNTGVNLAVLPPGSAFSMGITSGLVSAEAITVIAATTGHQFYAKEF